MIVFLILKLRKPQQTSVIQKQEIKIANRSQRHPKTGNQDCKPITQTSKDRKLRLQTDHTDIQRQEIKVANRSHRHPKTGIKIANRSHRHPKTGN
jgi:hypothetical protein